MKNLAFSLFPWHCCAWWKQSYVALYYYVQLIESRVSTFESAIQLSSCLDILYAGVGVKILWYRVQQEQVSGFFFFFFFFLIQISWTQVVDDDIEENATTVPVIYEDEDESDEEKSEDAMETDQDINDEEASVAFDGVSDIEGSDGLSDWCESNGS